MKEEEKLKLKIGLIGEENCGKTCFVKKLVHNAFDQDKISTIGVSIAIQELEELTIKFYDFSGDEKYNYFVTSLFTLLDAIIFIYDTTKEFPKNYFLEKIKNIEEKIQQKEDEKHIIYFMVETKNAIKKERKVSFDEVNKFCKENKINFIKEIDSKETKQKDLLKYIEKIVNKMKKKKWKKGIKAVCCC